MRLPAWQSTDKPIRLRSKNKHPEEVNSDLVTPMANFDLLWLQVHQICLKVCSTSNSICDWIIAVVVSLRTKVDYYSSSLNENNKHFWSQWIELIGQPAPSMSPAAPWWQRTRGILKPPARTYAPFISYKLRKWRFRCRTTGGGAWWAKGHLPVNAHCHGLINSHQCLH